MLFIYIQTMRLRMAEIKKEMGITPGQSHWHAKPEHEEITIQPTKLPNVQNRFKQYQDVKI